MAVLTIENLAEALGNLTIRVAQLERQLQQLQQPLQAITGSSAAASPPGLPSPLQPLQAITGPLQPLQASSSSLILPSPLQPSQAITGPLQPSQASSSSPILPIGILCYYHGKQGGCESLAEWQIRTWFPHVPHDLHVLFSRFFVDAWLTRAWCKQTQVLTLHLFLEDDWHSNQNQVAQCVWLLLALACDSGWSEWGRFNRPIGLVRACCSTQPVIALLLPKFFDLFLHMAGSQN